MQPPLCSALYLGPLWTLSRLGFRRRRRRHRRRHRRRWRRLARADDDYNAATTAS